MNLRRQHLCLRIVSAGPPIIPQDRAGSADRDKLMAALLATDTSAGPAKLYLGGHLSFDKTGRRANPVSRMLQREGTRSSRGGETPGIYKVPTRAVVNRFTARPRRCVKR